MTDDLHTFLRSRRSIHHFLADPVPVDVLQRILTTATYAPSAHNKQSWCFIFLINSESRSRLITAITDKFCCDMTADGAPEAIIQWRIERTNRQTSEISVIIVLYHDVAKLNSQRDTARQQAELTMGIQSIALTGLQILLAAEVEGFGGTWICWPLFASEETRPALDLPSSFESQGMLFFGHPAEVPDMPERKPLSNIVL